MDEKKDGVLSAEDLQKVSLRLSRAAAWYQRYQGCIMVFIAVRLILAIDSNRSSAHEGTVILIAILVERFLQATLMWGPRRQCSDDWLGDLVGSQQDRAEHWKG